MTKSSDQIGKAVLDGGGKIPVTMDMISGIIDDCITDFEESASAAFDAIYTDSDLAVEHAQEAEETYKQLGVFRTMAETFSILHANNTVSALNTEKLNATAGAAYLRMVPLEFHVRVREALKTLGRVDKEPSNSYRPGITPVGWNKDL